MLAFFTCGPEHNIHLRGAIVQRVERICRLLLDAEDHPDDCYLVAPKNAEKLASWMLSLCILGVGTCANGVPQI